MRHTKKAQLAVPFHWIYILLVGGVILLFFIGIVARQKEASETGLSITVLQKLDGIFTAATQTKKTYVPVELPDLELFFTCDDDDVAEYRINDGAPRSLNVQPVFAPGRLKTEPNIHTWSLPFALPFTVINLLMVSSPQTTTLLVFDSADPFSDALRFQIKEDVPPQLNFVEIDSIDFFSGTGYSLSTPFVHIIFVASITGDLPDKVARYPDDNVGAVRVENQRTLTYYHKDGSTLRADLDDSAVVIGGFDDRNPSFYAGLFSQDKESYACNMRKVFDRLLILSELYHQRAERIQNDYITQGNTLCGLQFDPDLFLQLKSATHVCRDVMDGSCITQIYARAEQLQQRDRIVSEQCAGLF
jgi:hypothetical protein